MAKLNKDIIALNNHTRYKSIAVILNLVFPGLGNIYAGKLIKGMLIYLGYCLAIILILITALIVSQLFLLLLIVPIILVIIDSILTVQKIEVYTLKPYNRWYFYTLFILICIISSNFLFSPLITYNIAQTFEFPAGSMENTLLVGDKVLVNKLSYGIHIPFSDKYLTYYNNIKLGDLVIFLFPGERDERESKAKLYYCHRCVGLPGDTVRIDDKKLYINNVRFSDPKGVKFISPLQTKKVTNPRIFPIVSQWNEDNYGPIRIPMAGDRIKIDSSNYLKWKIFIQREGNTITIDKENKIFVNDELLEEGYYSVKRDYIFTMGDNRNNSLDSRYWGFVPVESVTGKISSIYWSWDTKTPLYELVKRIASIRWSRILTKVD